MIEKRLQEVSQTRNNLVELKLKNERVVFIKSMRNFVKKLLKRESIFIKILITIGIIYGDYFVFIRIMKTKMKFYQNTLIKYLILNTYIDILAT